MVKHKSTLLHDNLDEKCAVHSFGGGGGELNNSRFWKIDLINRNQNVSEIDNRLLAIITSSLIVILLMTGLSVFRNEVGVANRYANRSCTKQG